MQRPQDDPAEKPGGADPGEELVRLLATHKDRLYSFLVSVTHDRSIALDCSQETFLRAYKNLGQGKPVNGHWLYRVARNLAVDEFRRRQHEQAELDNVRELPAEQGVTSRETLAVRRVLVQLSQAEREVLHLFIVDRMSSAEIAEILHITPAAVRMRVSRSRARFRALYRELA